MHLVWAIGNAAKSAGGPDMRQWCVLAHAHATKDLHGAAGDIFTHFGGNNF